MFFSVSTVTYIFIFSILTTESTSIVYTTRAIKEIGTSGLHDGPKRWSDAVPTAIHPRIDGPKQKFGIVRSSRYSPVARVFGSVAPIPNQCNSNDNKTMCGSALDGFGVVGEVQFSFHNSRQNVKGQSSQVMMACKCLGTECRSAISVRPIIVYNNFVPDNDTIGETCIYEARIDKRTKKPTFSDCYSEALRIVRAPKKKLPIHKYFSWIYAVADKNGNKWSATGSRKYEMICTSKQLAKLPRINISSIKKEDVGRNDHSTPVTNSPCQAPEGYMYYLDADDRNGKECAKIYSFARTAAADSASQVDAIATGEEADFYQSRKPQLTSANEITLAMSAASLGILVLWDRFQRQMKKTRADMFYLLGVSLLSIMLFGLEALPVHVAFDNERTANVWASAFTYAEATLSLAKEQTKPEGNAAGSIVIITTIVGSVQYIRSKESVLLILMVISDAIAAIFLILTSLGIIDRIRRARKVEKYVTRDDYADYINNGMNQFDKRVSYEIVDVSPHEDKHLLISPDRAYLESTRIVDTE